MNLNFLLPRQPHFFVYFKEQGECLNEIAFLFRSLSKEYKDFDKYSLKAEEIEHRADRVTRKIIDKLNRTVITPIDREDIHLLARKTDMVIDLIENVIGNINLYGLENKIEAVEKFGEVIFQACKKNTELINQLGRFQKYPPHFKETVIEIHELEDKGDQIFENAIVELFKEENNPILIIKWKDILENMELVTDMCKNLSSIIEGVAIKTS